MITKNTIASIVNVHMSLANYFKTHHKYDVRHVLPEVVKANHKLVTFEYKEGEDTILTLVFDADGKVVYHNGPLHQAVDTTYFYLKKDGVPNTILKFFLDRGQDQNVTEPDDDGPVYA